MNTPQDHDWALVRLTRFATGTMLEPDALRMHEHLEVCVDCRARLEPLRLPDRLEAAHLPASLIATWARSAKRLSTLERELVGRHLETCASCRQTLEFSGHAPVLPELTMIPVRRERVVDLRRARLWAFGLTGAAAAAAAWLLVVQPALIARDPRTSATMGGTLHVGARVIIESLRSGVPAGARTLPPLDDSGARALRLSARELRDGTVLGLPAGLLPADQADQQRRVILTLRAHGRDLGALSSSLGAIGTAVRLRSDMVLAPGRYELQISIAARGNSAEPAVWLYTLHVY